MLKLLLLLAIIVVAVLLVRNVLKQLGGNKASAPPPTDAPAPPPEAKLVRCVECGAFVPKEGAVAAGGGYRCGGAGCRPGS